MLNESFNKQVDEADEALFIRVERTYIETDAELKYWFS